MTTSLTKTVISEDFQNILMGKEFPKSTGIVSPFKKVNNIFVSGFDVPQNRTHRLNEIYNMIPHVARVLEGDDVSSFDCISAIDSHMDVLRQHPLENGILHFDVLTSNVDGKIICAIHSRLLIKFIEEESKEIKLKKINKFETSKIKIFSVMMTKGFITCIANNKKTILHIIVNNCEKNIVGTCINDDNQKMLKSINLLWPIFTFNFKKSIMIRARNGIFGKETKYPNYFTLERNIDESVANLVDKGESLYIE